MAWNDFKWLILCSALSLLVWNGQNRSGVPEIWPKIAEKYAKYAKIKVFDNLIKIDLLVWVGNQFKWLVLCSSSSGLVLNSQQGSGFPELWAKMSEKLAKHAKIKVKRFKMFFLTFFKVF